MQVLREQHNTDAYDLHPHQLSWKRVPWLDQPTWLRNATQLQPGDFTYRSGGCMRQCLRGHRGLQLRLSPAHACCQAVAGCPQAGLQCLLRGFSPESIRGMSAALRPGSGTSFAGFLLSVVRNSFSFLSLRKGKIMFPKVVPSSRGCGHWLPKGGNNRIENMCTKTYFCQWLKCIRCNNKELKINMTNPGSQQHWLLLC